MRARAGADVRAVALRPRSALAVLLASLGGLLAFCWPLLVSPDSALADDSKAPLVFALLLPVVLAVVLLEVSEGGLDPKAVAMLGVLSAVGAALRPMGAGTAGLETVFFLLVLAGRVFGAGFGFVLGATTLFGSALITGGVGPWLPYQMLGAAWAGVGAGLLPPVPRRWELLLLASYGAVAGLLYGVLLNLSGWPYGLGAETQLSFVPGGSTGENLHRFVLYSLSTSLGWDLGRALTNVVLILVTGKAVLATLRRAARKASFAPRGSTTVGGGSEQTGRGVDAGPDQTLHQQGERPGEHDPGEVDAQLGQRTRDL
ncbi:MAG: ECF transporter S component [Marmoricola sp.]